MASAVWIPAFAGMAKIKTCPCQAIKRKWIRQLRFCLDFSRIPMRIPLCWGIFANSPQGIDTAAASGL